MTNAGEGEGVEAEDGRPRERGREGGPHAGGQGAALVPLHFSRLLSPLSSLISHFTPFSPLHAGSQAVPRAEEEGC
jgi:hypothetical protein